ncbi:MAG: hypothetical protein WBD55_09945 [Dehalococcoidia bacterium]
MSRILLALVTGGIVFGAVIGAAASLGGISPATLGADDATVISCDTDGVSASYDTDFIGGEFVVTDVTVEDISLDCDDKTVDVVLTDGGSNVGEGSGTASGGSALVSVSPAPSAEAVDDIHISIHD